MHDGGGSSFSVVRGRNYCLSLLPSAIGTQLGRQAPQCPAVAAGAGPIRLETTSETVKLSDAEREQLEAGLQRIAELDEKIQGLQQGFGDGTSQSAGSRQSVRSTRCPHQQLIRMTMIVPSLLRLLLLCGLAFACECTDSHDLDSSLPPPHPLPMAVYMGSNTSRSAPGAPRSRPTPAAAWRTGCATQTRRTCSDRCSRPRRSS